MKFVEEHLTKHHLFHAPHKWFLAALISPIHACEMHYKYRYHMQFAHARKLFLFDLSLIGTLITIGVSALLWSFYNPTVTNLVYLTVTPSQGRILSGEYVTYTIQYENKSEKRLSHSVVSLEVPDGFIIDKSEPHEKYDEKTHSFDLGTIDTKGEGSVSIGGLLYGNPSKEDHIHASLTYRQDGATRTETKVSPHMIFLRGSVLEMGVDMADQVIENARIPLTITLRNNGEEELHDVSFDLHQFDIIGNVEHISVTKGENQGSVWNIKDFVKNNTAVLTATLVVSAQLSDDAYTLELAPTIAVKGNTVAQTAVKKVIQIARPDADISTSWGTEVTALKPGETGRLSVLIKNSGTIALEHGVIEIPLSGSLINLAAAARENLGTISKNTLSITYGKHAGLESIPVGESRTVTILLPITTAPDGGTDIVLRPTIRFKASAVGVPEATVDRTASPASLKIGTQVVLTGEVRYYTAEGDQLGRGPLPPQVGKETKYAVLYSLRNTTSNVTGGVFTAKLPNYVTWTGKTSVTQGSAPTYNGASRTITWAVGALPAHATAGIFFEISLTPVASQREQTPTIVTSGSFSGYDTYLGYTLSRDGGALDSSLSTDPLGKAKGSTVE